MNKQEIIDEISKLQSDLLAIENLENEYKIYIGKYYKLRVISNTDFKSIYFKLLSFWKFNGKLSLFKALDVDVNEKSIFINTYRLEDLTTEITKEEFEIEFNKTLNSLKTLL